MYSPTQGAGPSFGVKAEAAPLQPQPQLSGISRPMPVPFDDHMKKKTRATSDMADAFELCDWEDYRGWSQAQKRAYGRWVTYQLQRGYRMAKTPEQMKARHDFETLRDEGGDESAVSGASQGTASQGSVELFMVFARQNSKHVGFSQTLFAGGSQDTSSSKSRRDAEVLD